MEDWGALKELLLIMNARMIKNEERIRELELNQSRSSGWLDVGKFVGKAIWGLTLAGIGFLGKWAWDHLIPSWK